jgi:alcohol dehydrogenase
MNPRCSPETVFCQGPFAESRPLVIEQVELDDPGPEGVLIRIGAAGLCHSETPMVLGQEAAGRDIT